MLKNILNSHHAILVEGNPLVTMDIIKNELIEQGMVIPNNPDLIFLNFNKFGIDESRQIIEMANGAPVQEDKKRIIFGFNSMTGEAQNALLKILEDPSPQLSFILITYTSNGLLPTLRSRLQVCGSDAEEQRGMYAEKNVEEFMNMSIGERIERIEKMVKDYKDTSDKQTIKDFLLSLHHFFENNLKKGSDSKDMTALKASAKALDYLEDKSSSVKILLESVALAL